jgi:hypothetical protein
MVAKRTGGPVSMSGDELAAFLAGSPAGAICVIDDDGDLIALPGRVVDYRDDVLVVSVVGADPAPWEARRTEACMVADTFRTYQDIRGVIAQGSVSPQPGRLPGTVAIDIARTLTFSFENA